MQRYSVLAMPENVGRANSTASASRAITVILLIHALPSGFMNDSIHFVLSGVARLFA